MRLKLQAMTLVLTGLLVLALLAALGCTGDGQSYGADGLQGAIAAAGGELLLDGLPALPEDAGRPRLASAESDQTVLGSETFLKSEFADPVGDTLVLQTSPPAPLQYGIYEFPLAGNTPLRVAADVTLGTGPFFLGVANYARGSWELSGPLDSATTQYQLTPGADYASPGDAVYVALIAARLDAADANVTVNSVTLTSDDGAAPTFSILGSVKNGIGDPQPGVSVQLNPGDLLDITGVDGAYEFSGLQPGDYVVAPTLAGYLLWPPSQEVTITDSDVSVPEFIATENKLVTGWVTDGPESGISDIELHLIALNENGSINSGGYRMATTDVEGNYEFEGMVAGDYRLIPQADGYVFDPGIVEFTFSDSMEQNFSGQTVGLPDVVNFTEHMLPWLFEPVCMNCHDSAKTGPERNFAPLTVDWDSYSGTTEFSKTSANTRIQGDTMPPATLHFKTTQFHKDLYQKWLDGGFVEN